MKKIVLYLFVSSLFLINLNANKLDEVKSSGVLKAGVKYDFKPFGFKNSDGELVGFDIDLINYIAIKLGVEPDFSQVTSKTRIPMVKRGSIDIAAASMTHKVSRDKDIDFTISYFFDGQSFLVRKNSKVRTPQGFAYKKVAAIQGATSGKNLKELVPKARIVYYQEYSEALSALKEGMVEAITTDLVWCVAQASDSKGLFKTTAGTISYEPYGMGVAENESDFLDAVNFALQDAVKDGTYTKLYKKWFKKEPTVLPELWP